MEATTHDEAPIPDDWKRDVYAVLHRGTGIIVRTSAQRRYCDSFANATKYDLFDAMAEALSCGTVMGRHVTDMQEPGETYTFKFFPEGRDFFGKICLCHDRKTIIIYSAHISLKGDKL